MSDGEFKGYTFYIASDNKNNAHGDTVKEAIAELAFKSSDRDVSQYKDMSLDTTKTPQEWGFVYRNITGACAFGVKDFIASKELKESYTLAEIIKETDGAYAHHTFKQFFERN